MPRKKRAATGMCVKCKTEKGKILRLSIAYCKYVGVSWQSGLQGPRLIALLCRPCFQLQYYVRLAKTLHPPLYPEPTVITTTTVPPNGQTPVKQLVGRPPQQAGDVVIGLSGGAGSMSLLDMLVVKGYIATKADADGKETANGTVLLERGKKKATWRKAWAVHVNFSNVIPEVSDIRSTIAKAHPNSQLQDVSAMIAVHLEEMYPTHNIELVVIQAEDTYDSSLVSRLRAYGVSLDNAASLPASSSVTVDLLKPGQSTSIQPAGNGVTNSLSQSCPSPHRPPTANHLWNLLRHCFKHFPPPLTHTYSTTSSPPSFTLQALTCRTLRNYYSARLPLDKRRISLRAQPSATAGVSLSNCKESMCYRKQWAFKR